MDPDLNMLYYINDAIQNSSRYNDTSSVMANLFDPASNFFASSAIGVSLPVFNGHGLKVGTCTQYLKNDCTILYFKNQNVHYLKGQL